MPPRRIVASIVAIIIMVAAGALVASPEWHRDAPTAPKPSQPTTLESAWTTFTGPKCGFSIQYPIDWTVISSRDAATGTVLHVRTDDGGERWEYPYSSKWSSATVSCWSDMNSKEAQAGSASQRTYASLNDYFDDQSEYKFKRRVGAIEVSGFKGYKVHIYGYASRFAIMVERPHGIIELSFSDAMTESDLTSLEKRIIASFEVLR